MKMINKKTVLLWISAALSAGWLCFAGSLPGRAYMVPSEYEPAEHAPSQSAALQDRTVIGQVLDVQLPASAKPWIAELNGLSLQPGQNFSLAVWSVQLETHNGFQEDCEVLEGIATLLMQTAVQARLEIGERHQHPQLPADTAPGFDVSFRGKTQDFILRNPHRYPVQFQADLTDKVSGVRLYALVPEAQNPAELRITEEIVTPGERVVEDHGQDALARSIPGKEGKLITVSELRSDGTEQLLYKDYYALEAAVTYTLPAVLED